MQQFTKIETARLDDHKHEKFIGDLACNRTPAASKLVSFEADNRLVLLPAPKITAVREVDSAGFCYGVRISLEFAYAARDVRMPSKTADKFYDIFPHGLNKKQKGTFETTVFLSDGGSWPFLSVAVQADA